MIVATRECDFSALLLRIVYRQIDASSITQNVRLFSASTCASHCKLRRLRANDRLSALLASQFIGLYREFAIAIQDEVGDSNGGNV